MTLTKHLLRMTSLFTFCIGTLMSSTVDAKPTTQYEAEPTTKQRGYLEIKDLKSKPGKLRLPYDYYRRASARPTIVFLSGGPGLSNLSWTPPSSWLEDFDVVMLEYRGVGQSSVVLKSKAFREAVSIPTATLSLADAAPVRAKIEQGFQELTEQGLVLQEFSLEALVDDIERLRQQLQIPQLYLVAHSFGTRVALWYQTKYRAHTGGSILFSLNTPGGFIWYPQDTLSVWTRYRDRQQSTRPEFAAQLDELLQNEQARKTRFGLFNLSDSRALTVAFFLSFNQATRDRALRAMVNAKHGDTATWSMFALSYPFVTRFSFNWADFFAKAYSTDCDMEALALADAQGPRSPFQSPSSVLFSACEAYLSRFQNGPVNEQKMPALDVADYRNTLAVVGEFDPSTPIERRPAGLADDAFLVIKNAGHADVLYSDPEGSVKFLRRRFLTSPSSFVSSGTP